MLENILSNPLIILFLLLPIAAGSGYLWGTRSSKRTEQLNDDYFQALNDLLSDRTEKAIEAFSRLAENKQDEVNLHLALGLLFRRRGELDRAIYVHHRLLKNPALQASDRVRVQLALADNYYRSGILDRAETLLTQIIAECEHATEDRSESILSATKQLLYILEQEKDWQRAIDQCLQLKATTDITLSSRLAHYHNELALLATDHQTRAHHVQKSLDYHPDSARSMIAAIQLAIDEERLADARAHLHHIAGKEPWVLPQIARQAIPAFDTKEAFIAFLEQQIQHTTSPRLHSVLADMYRELGNYDQSLIVLDEALSKTPSFLLIQRLLRSEWNKSVEPEPRLAAMLNAARALLDTEAKYQCNNCGVTLIQHRWQCPGCYHWDTVFPLADLVPTPYQRPAAHSPVTLPKSPTSHDAH